MDLDLYLQLLCTKLKFYICLVNWVLDVVCCCATGCMYY
jgi:hypothetical protein